MTPLSTFLQQHAEGDLLPWAAQKKASDTFNLSLAQVEQASLKQKLLPARYQRNREIISTEDQLQLCQSTAAVIGCGGLGGYIIEELARLGVGHIIAIDPDTFEEHNLNRQLLSTPDLLGRPKAEAALKRVAQINPAVTVTAHELAFSEENGHELLAGAHIVVDALDNIGVRLDLGLIAKERNIPLVHGAIAGWYGHVATQFPGDDILQKIYPRGGPQKGIEQRLGNPSFTPAVVASLEATEACKALLGKGVPLQSRMLTIDLLEMEIMEIPF